MAVMLIEGKGASTRRAADLCILLGVDHGLDVATHGGHPQFVQEAPAQEWAIPDPSADPSADLRRPAADVVQEGARSLRIILVLM
jgi:hypothetical protein